MCVAGLVCAYGSGICCCVIASGRFTLSSTTSAATTAFKNGEFGYNTPTTFHNWQVAALLPWMAELLPLLLNFLVTLLTECTGLIHTTTLRWALGNRLTFNSNPRLFTSSPKYASLSWPANVLFTGFLISSYTATSMMFATTPPQQWCDSHKRFGIPVELGCGDTVVLSPPAVVCLGIAMLGQAIRSNMAVRDSTSPNMVC